MNLQIVFVILTLTSVQPQTHPGAEFNVVELIQEYGYPVERHRDVQTADGYLLELHRIPHGMNNSNSAKKPAVLLLHCYLCSSAEWIYTGPSRGLGFILADRGYDVWLGNSRGNTWSRKHVKYDPNRNPEFWDFDLEDMATEDLPSMIDYVLKETDHESLYYIGHSQATALFFIMASEMPEYNDKIRLMTAMGPAAYLRNLKGLVLNTIMRYSVLLQLPIADTGPGELLRYNEGLKLLGDVACNDHAITQPFCAEIIFSIVGNDPQQLNNSLIPVVVGYTPAGASRKQSLHFAQLSKSGGFRKFNYGKAENLKRYGTTTPPDYNLTKITAPVGLYYGENDWIVSVAGVKKLSQELSNLVVDYQVPFKYFNHLDFLWSNDVFSLLYETVLHTLEKY